MKIEFTKHAAEKYLQEDYIESIKITKKKVKDVVKNPKFSKKQGKEKIFAVGNLSRKHVLVVVYKSIGKKAKIITFFPAQKGRYEG